MKALSLLIKPASGGCNMLCKYCFYANVTDSRLIKHRGMMKKDMLELIVKKALGEVTHACTFGFQGGEPTLIGLDFFRDLVAFEKKYNVNRVQVRHTIQTNGMLIDEQWAAFMAENNFLVGLSVDGGAELHDHYRVDTKGEGTHKRCMQAAKLFREYKVDFNILSVVTNPMAKHPERVYSFYKKNDFRYVQFIPCLDGFGENGGAEYSLKPQHYGKFLCRIFDLWYADLIKGEYISIRAFDNYIHMLMGYPPENCAMNGVCSTYPLIEADGEVYPCDFYALDEYLLGSITSHSFEELLHSQQAENFMLPSRKIEDACKACPYLRICRGGCRRERELAGEGIGLNGLCPAYRMFFAHALPRMQLIARNMQTQRGPGNF